ncbi:unnamed protein product [Rotaria magnacalcarata]|uniref:Uncharacterized protein n=1 Tax=Rotaria magnacalcarata TaxID=392030 RepID=A0A8S2QM87_9BILA|nr:unnamed protein product [Rotaria magnacalcarata]CAF4166667.1 unnamed protein product [Rotaria magnacalcarata]
MSKTRHEIIDEISTIDSNRNSIDDQVITSVCDSTNESAASINERNINKSLMKTTRKSHQEAAQDQSSNEDENKKHRQRSVSSSSSTSTSSSTSADNETSNIPYETLRNEDEDDQSDPITQ